MAYDSITWIDPAGVETPLHYALAPDGTGSAINADTLRGFGAPPVEFEEIRIPFQPGTQLRDVYVGPRECGFLLFVRDTDATTFRVRERALIRAMDQTRGDGRLRITSVDGRVRD